MADTAPKTEPVVPPQRQLPPPADKPHHGWIWILILFLIAAGIAAFVIFGRHKPPSRAMPPLTISTTNAFKGDIDIAVNDALGTVTPVYTVSLSSRVDGQIVAVHYTEGQTVNTNDVLVEIDPAPFQAQKLVAEGQLERDKAMLEAANIDLQRYQLAYEKKAIPQQQVQDQQALVHQDEGVVRLDQGALSNAAVQLNYCYVRSPISGRIGLRLVDPGNVVHAANTNAMAVITQLQPITVIFSVAEDYLPQIQRQIEAGHVMTVQAYDRAQEHVIATGKFMTMDNLIDQATGTIRVRASFQNESNNLFPNQFVNARLIIDTLRDQTLVPTPAIQRNPQGAFVYVVTNQVVQTATNQITNSFVTMRDITVGVSDQNVTAVEGIDPGETIATDNFNKLGEGTRVNVRERGAGGAHGGGKGRRAQGLGHGGKMTNGPARRGAQNDDDQP